MIHLYLVRHGAAEDAAGIPDALRTLTAKARRRFRKAARSLARKSGAIDLVLTSPLVRAVQTAEILAGEVKHRAFAVLPELAPEHDVAAILKAVSRARKQGSIALVGHEPQIGRLLAQLAQVPAAKAAKLDIRPGAIIRIDVIGLPQAKAAEGRWWIKSGPRHKGLPWKKEKAPAKPKKAASAPQKLQKMKTEAPAKKKPAPKPAAAAPPAIKPAAPPPPATKPAAPSQPRFMGTPRPTPAPSPAAAPSAAPSEKPPSDGSPPA
ncbi:MAG TPA: phosphohistidine phosphatase SixA [Myxococcales bacterium]